MNPEAARLFDRAMRRKLLASDGGDLQHDLASAVIEAAIAVRPGEVECTVAELNEMFGLCWLHAHYVVPLADLDAAITEVSWNLLAEENVVDLLQGAVAGTCSVVGSSPRGTATMMCDDGVGLYEFAIDDGVYFFVLAERDVCDSSWWFAHGVGDLASRVSAIQDAQLAFGISDLFDA